MWRKCGGRIRRWFCHIDNVYYLKVQAPGLYRSRLPRIIALSLSPFKDFEAARGVTFQVTRFTYPYIYVLYVLYIRKLVIGTASRMLPSRSRTKKGNIPSIIDIWRLVFYVIECRMNRL